MKNTIHWINLYPVDRAIIGFSNIYRCGYMASTLHAESPSCIWPVTGQGFQNTKWPAVLYSQQILQNRKIPANLNYHNVNLEKSSDPEMLYRSLV